MARSSRILLLSALLGATPSIAPAAESQGPAPQERSPEALQTSDWSAIRAAHAAARRAVVESAMAHFAHNPGQNWTTRFDGRGATTQPDAGGWTWGLELVRYGFEGQERGVSGRACASSDGERLTYEWDAALDEWYVNGARGLEHGFTLRERPEGEGTLAFTLSVRGDLVARVQSDGRGASFTSADGRDVLTYSGLEVFDADGRALPAGIELHPRGLRVLVDERGARYPLTVDPLAHQAYLKASNTDGGDEFGVSVAISGDTIVVGARNEDSAATGVNGNQADNGAANAGAAYVFVRSGTAWSQQAYLKASNTGAEDLFGHSVQIHGDTVVVGAYGEDSAATGVNGNGSDDSAAQAGAAYVFVRTGTAWSQQAYFKPSNTEAGDAFGTSVALAGDTAVVGATGEDSSATGIDGDSTSNAASGSGAAYVFTRNGGTWSQQAYVKASNTGANDQFGCAVAASGDTLVVGAYGEASNATGVNGDQSNNSFLFSGAAYVFVRSGAAWSQQVYLKASNTATLDSFGAAVAVDGETVLVGAKLEASNATGIGGDQSNNSMPSSGACYVFSRAGPTWGQLAYVKASNTGSGDQFGYALALSGSTLVVGAWAEGSSATGVNGDQSNNSANRAGAAYVLDDVVAGTATPYCFGDGTGTACPCGNSGAAGNGCANSDSAAGGGLTVTGTASLSADTLVLSGSGMPNASALYFQGTTRVNGGLGAAFGDGLRCAGGTVVRLGTKANAAGASQYPGPGDLSVSLRGSVTGPGTRTYQAWYHNAASYCTADTFNLTNGVEVTWVP